MTLNELKFKIKMRRMMMFWPALISLATLMTWLAIGKFFPSIMENAVRNPDYLYGATAALVVGGVLLWLYLAVIFVAIIDNIKVPDVYLDYLADVINDLPAPEALDSFGKNFADKDLTLTYGEVSFFLAGQNIQKEKLKSKIDSRQIGPGAARLRDRLERMKMFSA